MRIQTMSIVVGSKACNARCPFCVSRLTPEQGLLIQSLPILPITNEEVNWRNFKIACELANRSGVTTVLLTGKGEPTLYPDLITKYLEELKPYNIPFKELQTNGILLENGIKTRYSPFSWGQEKIYFDTDALCYWYSLGLTTVCLSIVNPASKLNKEIYQPSLDTGYMDVTETIRKIRASGLMVRLSCMLLKGHIDSVTHLQRLIEFCKDNDVKQLTVRPIDAPSNVDNEVSKWVHEKTLGFETERRMKEYIANKGTPILELAHGGIVYDVDGQNVCWANCLTTNKSTEDIRQIIFFSDGTISHSWVYKGAVFL